MNYEDRMCHLERARQRLLNTLQGVDNERLNRAPDDGGWSPGQILAHVIEAERKSLDYVRKKARDPASLCRRTLRQWVNGWVLVMAMKSPFKFEVPPVVGEPPQAVDLAALTDKWEEVRKDWRGFVADFPAELADRAVYRHPVAGPLTLNAALRFLVTHLRRHTRQVKRSLG